jgi:predicted TIM-barrel fold metal-dependent hydrolase
VRVKTNGGTNVSPVIDVHHHMLAPSLLAALTAAGVDRVGGEPLPEWSPEASLRLMDRYGIDVAVLSVPVPLHFAPPERRARLARTLNEYGRTCIRRWPDRFAFFATLPLPDVEASLQELRHAIDDLGADGVALLTNHAGVYQGAARFDPLYAELDACDAVAFIHPTVSTGSAMPRGNEGSPLAGLQPSVLEFPFETTRAVANLLVSGTLERFPRVRYVVTHCGGCVSSMANRLIDRAPIVSTYLTMLQRGAEPSITRLEETMHTAQAEAVARLGRLFYDVALSTDQHVLAALTALVPPAQLLLGTDFPMGQEIGVHLTLDGLDHFDGLSEEQRDAVRAGNASALLPRFAVTAVA